MALEAATDDKPVTIKVHWHEGDEVEDVEWEWSERAKGLPVAARGMGETVRAFVEGRGEGDGWVGIGDARGRAGEIWGMLGG